MRCRILFRFLIFVFLFSFLRASAALPAPPSGADNCKIYRGKASWYGPGFHNLKTASGARFDQNELTAASRTLPMNSWVMVSYNGRSIPVEINDRGPYVKGRIIDLSKRAATELGIRKIGVAVVTISTCLLSAQDYVESFNPLNEFDES